MHKITLLIVIIAILVVSSLTYAQTCTSPNYSILNPRIVISGGKASSLSYCLSFVTVGSVLGGVATSAGYSLDITQANLETLMPPPPPDTTPPVITSLTPLDAR